MILLAPAAGVALAVVAPRHLVGPVPAAAWLGFGYAGLLSMFLGSVAWYRGLAAGGTARIGQLNLAQPFLAIAWSGLLLGEQIAWPVAATAPVIIMCTTICIRTGQVRTGQRPYRTVITHGPGAVTRHRPRNAQPDRRIVRSSRLLEAAGEIRGRGPAAIEDPVARPQPAQLTSPAGRMPLRR
jgi:uncharacterized membrane protein